MHALDRIRKTFNGKTSRADRSQIGQFLTPVVIARFMSSLFEWKDQHVRILDPGAGAGTLFSACIEDIISRKLHPLSITIVAYETDAAILPYLSETMTQCEKLCILEGIAFHGFIKNENFISDAVAKIGSPLFIDSEELYTHAILNPPYMKINSHSAISRQLYASQIEVANLYAVFVWLSMLLLKPDGQMTAITPRSFCNGPYFKKFRIAFLRNMALNTIHIFSSRRKAFGDDSVLQENIIHHAVRSFKTQRTVRMSISDGPDFDRVQSSSVPYGRVVHPGDRDMYIHLDAEETCVSPAEQIKCFTSSLYKLGLEVSTGRVVDFRAKEYLRQDASRDTVPLIYPCHFLNGFIEWPVASGKKPNAIMSTAETSDILIESGFYVLIKRFSSKEQARRVMAAIYDPTRLDTRLIGFENHLNYFHKQGTGLSADLAKGLAVYLNSTVVDKYFRLFSGHTQVNAADLRKMPYPTHEQLVLIGAHIGDQMPEQETIDAIIERECLHDEQ